MKLLKQVPATKGDQTVDLAFKLGVDPKQSDQMVRGTVALPAGSGKNVRVLVFAKGAAAEAAKAAGAEFVGFEDLIKKVTEGFQDFDVAVATPEAMAEVRKLGRVLGPRGLMPNPKTGTVTDDTAKAVKECKAGRVEFKLDKAAQPARARAASSPSSPRTSRPTAAPSSRRSSAAVPPRPRAGSSRPCTLSSTISPGIRIDLAPFLSA